MNSIIVFHSLFPSLTPMPCEEKEKLWRLFPFPSSRSVLLRQMASLQKPNSFPMPAVQCGAQQLMACPCTRLGRGLTGSQGQPTALLMRLTCNQACLDILPSFYKLWQSKSCLSVAVAKEWQPTSQLRYLQQGQWIKGVTPAGAVCSVLRGLERTCTHIHLLETIAQSCL